MKEDEILSKRTGQETSGDRRVAERLESGRDSEQQSSLDSTSSISASLSLPNAQRGRCEVIPQQENPSSSKNACDSTRLAILRRWI
ncbi:hypothetical protein N9M41_02525 [Rhodopirellula sp.]|jgi:hypothetical protein|nr:hypothetical protein [Rhodopirellula sp.]